jgi:hypothetical protein
MGNLLLYSDKPMLAEITGDCPEWLVNVQNAA